MAGLEVKIYGSSDDLIEIEGALSEEHYVPEDGDGKTNAALCFSDGTLLTVEYDEAGIWRIHRVARGVAEFVKDEDPGDDENRYSDVVTLRYPDYSTARAVEEPRWVAYARVKDVKRR